LTGRATRAGAAALDCGVCPLSPVVVSMSGVMQ
jgi:hypothetical protein